MVSRKLYFGAVYRAASVLYILHVYDFAEAGRWRTYR